MREPASVRKFDGVHEIPVGPIKRIDSAAASDFE